LPPSNHALNHNRGMMKYLMNGERRSKGGQVRYESESKEVAQQREKGGARFESGRRDRVQGRDQGSDWDEGSGWDQG
jgi:hypothetical protein